MIKKYKLFFGLTIGVIIMFNLLGCFVGEKYQKYSSIDPAINIVTDYPLAWKFSETKGSYNSYSQVVFFPVGKENSGRTVMAITVRDSSKIEISPLTLAAFAEDILAKRKQYKDFIVLSKKKISLLGREAISMELSYKSLENLLKRDAKVVPFLEKIVVFKKGNAYYTLRYEDPSENFPKFSRAFEHLVKSLRFK